MIFYSEHELILLPENCHHSPAPIFLGSGLEDAHKSVSSFFKGGSCCLFLWDPESFLILWTDFWLLLDKSDASSILFVDGKLDASTWVHYVCINDPEAWSATLVFRKSQVRNSTKSLVPTHFCHYAGNQPWHQGSRNGPERHTNWFMFGPPRLDKGATSYAAW